MKLHAVRADPAGNITFFILDPVSAADQTAVALRVMERFAGDAEQMGFIKRPIRTADVRLEMMGGEFCGNAARSAGYWFALQNNMHYGCVRIECSGCSEILHVETDLEKHTAKIDMPLPLNVETCRIAGTETKMVQFPGICHMVVEGREPDERLTREGIREMMRLPGTEAAGMIYWDPDAGTMRPIVFVKATDTLIYENSCASGSAAVAASRMWGIKEGDEKLILRQPGGILEVYSEKTSDSMRISLSGPVLMGQTFQIEI